MSSGEEESVREDKSAQPEHAFRLTPQKRKSRQSLNGKTLRCACSFK